MEILRIRGGWFDRSDARSQNPRGERLELPSRIRAGCRSALCFVIFLLGAIQADGAEFQQATEYQLKAALLYNFAKFVEWPAKRFPNSQSPLHLCVLGEDPFRDDLERTIKNETVGGRTVAIRRFGKIPDRELCHILFISASEKERLGGILASLKQSTVLTVADVEGFTQLGGIIEFIIEERKIRFEINIDAADQAGLRISSKLLKLARIVREGAKP